MLGSHFSVQLAFLLFAMWMQPWTKEKRFVVVFLFVVVSFPALFFFFTQWFFGKPPNWFCHWTDDVRSDAAPTEKVSWLFFLVRMKPSVCWTNENVVNWKESQECPWPPCQQNHNLRGQIDTSPNEHFILALKANWNKPSRKKNPNKTKTGKLNSGDSREFCHKPCKLNCHEFDSNKNNLWAKTLIRWMCCATLKLSQWLKWIDAWSLWWSLSRSPRELLRAWRCKFEADPRRSSHEHATNEMFSNQTFPTFLCIWCAVHGAAVLKRNVWSVLFEFDKVKSLTEKRTVRKRAAFCKQILIEPAVSVCQEHTCVLFTRLYITRRPHRSAFHPCGCARLTTPTLAGPVTVHLNMNMSCDEWENLFIGLREKKMQLFFPEVPFLLFPNQNSRLCVQEKLWSTFFRHSHCHPASHEKLCDSTRFNNIWWIDEFKKKKKTEMVQKWCKSSSDSFISAILAESHDKLKWKIPPPPVKTNKTKKNAFHLLALVMILNFNHRYRSFCSHVFLFCNFNRFKEPRCSHLAPPCPLSTLRSEKGLICGCWKIWELMTLFGAAFCPKTTNMWIRCLWFCHTHTLPSRCDRFSFCFTLNQNCLDFWGIFTKNFTNIYGINFVTCHGLLLLCFWNQNVVGKGIFWWFLWDSANPMTSSSVQADNKSCRVSPSSTCQHNIHPGQCVSLATVAKWAVSGRQNFSYRFQLHRWENKPKLWRKKIQAIYCKAKHLDPVFFQRSKHDNKYFLNGSVVQKSRKKKKKKHNTKQHVFFKVSVVIFCSFCQTNIFENFSRPKEALDEGISIQESAKCFQDRAPRFQAPQPQITCSCQNRRRAPPPNVFLSLAAFKTKMSGPRLMHVPVKPTSSSSSLVTNPRWAMPVRSTKLPFSLRFGSMMICTASQLGPASSQLSPHFSFKLSVRTAWCIRSMACSWLSNARNMSEICFPLLYQPLTLVEERLVALKRLKDACKAAAAHLGESWLGQFAVNVGGKERKKWWVAFTMSWSMKSHDTWTGRSGNCSCFRARANDLKTVSVFNKGLSSWSPFLSRSLNSLSSLPAMAVLITPIWKWTLRKNLFKLTHWDTSGGFSRSSFPPSLTILSFSSKTDWAASTLNVKTWFNTSLPLPNTVRRSLVTSWTNRKEPARILVNKSSWLSLSALNVLPCDRRNSLAKSTNISRSTKFVSNEGGFPSPPTMSATTRLPWGRKTGCGRGYCLFSKIPATLTPCLVLLSNWRQKGGSSWMPTLQLLYLLSNR